MLVTETIREISRSEKETVDLGARMADRLRGGELVALTGDLGAGKTVFIRGMARGLGIDPRQVTSPTFALIQTYPGRLALVHVDLYRLATVEDLREASMEELRRADSVVAVEWAERMGTLLPDDAIRVSIEDAGEDRREILIDWPGGPAGLQVKKGGED